MKKKIGPATFGDAQLSRPPLTLDEQESGYILNSPGLSRGRFTATQRVWVFVAGLLLASVFVGMMPAFTGRTPVVNALHLGFIVAVFATALLLLWYATRGRRAYIYVDLDDDEMREVVPNIVGAPTVLKRMPFAEIDGVRLDHGAEADLAALYLRQQDGEWEALAQFEGSRHQLSFLRERLACDVFRPQTPSASRPAANDRLQSIGNRTDSVHPC
ncbi:hypothetical protein [Yoonia litorea]|uniref:Uncharacterized protein n=1 Tax=Yoonia litorea TaxID=1123755 RepID=A0A1I6LWK9_9RHOB|nr:hypothetical protein [Yoonia litorea]SFS07823.1 hypothetical protein SAMN05444714_0967 [Yoonia litorea]